jgi:hypothetical protein
MTMRTKLGAGLCSPEKGTRIYCRVNSSQVKVATGRSAGLGPPSEPNALLCAERVEGAWEARRDSLGLVDDGGQLARADAGGESGRR